MSDLRVRLQRFPPERGGEREKLKESREISALTSSALDSVVSSGVSSAQKLIPSLSPPIHPLESTKKKNPRSSFMPRLPNSLFTGSSKSRSLS